MRFAKGIGSLVALILGSLSVQAGVVPGRWDKVEAQPVGTVMNVELNSGERLVGRLTDIEPTAMVIETENGVRRMDRTEVQEVSLPEGQDSVLNGAVAGALAGGLGGIAVGVLTYVNSDNTEAIIAAPLLGVGIGLGAGLAIDKAHHGNETIFKAKVGESSE